MFELLLLGDSASGSSQESIVKGMGIVDSRDFEGVVQIRFSEVLKMAATYECFTCTNSFECQTKKYQTLVRVIHELDDLAQENDFFNPKLKELLSDLHANQMCPAEPHLVGTNKERL